MSNAFTARSARAAAVATTTATLPRAARAVSTTPMTLPPALRWTRRDATQADVQVEGQLPDWLRGQLVRTAPAVFERGGWQSSHWFDGLALMYGFVMGDEGVRFTQCLLDSAFGRDVGTPRPSLASFQTPAKRSLWARLLSPIPEMTDNTNVNVVPWQGAWLAMTETSRQHVIDPGTLASRGEYAYEGALPARLATTAHPHFDFGRRALVNVGSMYGARSTLSVFRQSVDGRSRVVEGERSFLRPPYVHAFGLSPRRAVILDHPLRLEAYKLLFSNRGLVDALRWEPQRGARFWVLDRGTGAWSCHETEPFFCFHVVHTFDDGQDVVLDFLAFDDARVVRELQTARLAEETPELMPRLLRARLSPGKQSARLEVLDAQRFEFPSIAYRAQEGAPTDAVWGTALSRDWSATVVRVDLSGGGVARHQDDGITYGEPVFVPRPNASGRTEGVVLVVGSHADRERSTLAVLDAQHLTPLARCHVDLSLPLGFHGSFAAG